MAIRTDTYLKSRFETGDRPTQQDFHDLIDSKTSVGHTHDIADITGLQEALDNAGGIRRGPTVERPTTPPEGEAFYDTDTNQLLLANEAGDWVVVQDLNAPFNIEYLVIAGGGGGGYGGTTVPPGGGGAGGYRTNRTGQVSGGNSPAEPALQLRLNENYSVIIGSGGVGSVNNNGIIINATPGNDSTFHFITAKGGGFGGGGTYAGSGDDKGGDGGSGGGSAGGPSGAQTGGVGLTGQGHEGGLSTKTTGEGGSGGGGAGGRGGNSTTSVATSGLAGLGLSSDITGSPVIRAAGGMGGFTNRVAVAGLANTGNGGGGTAINAVTPPGADGGSGVVILRYPDTYTITGGTGLTFSTATVGTDKVTTFTAGAGTIQFELA